MNSLASQLLFYAENPTSLINSNKSAAIKDLNEKAKKDLSQRINHFISKNEELILKEIERHPEKKDQALKSLQALKNYAKAPSVDERKYQVALNVQRVIDKIYGDPKPKHQDEIQDSQAAVPELPRDVLATILKLVIKTPLDLRNQASVNRQFSKVAHDPTIIRNLFKTPVIELNLTGKQAVQLLSYYGQYVNNLQLDFSHCMDLEDSDLKLLANSCKEGLTALILPKSLQLTDTGLKELAQCKELKSLEFLGYQDIKGHPRGYSPSTVLGDLALGCPNLEKLTLLPTYKVLNGLERKYTLRALDPAPLVNMPNLKSIKLPMSFHLQYLLKKEAASENPWTHLEALDFFYYWREGEKRDDEDLDLRRVIEKNQGLKHLNMPLVYRLNKETIDAICKCPNLESLKCNVRNVPAQNYIQLLNACPIKSLEVRLEKITEPHFIEIISAKNARNIESIVLPPNLTAKAATLLASVCVNLKSVECDQDTPPDVFQALIENCPSLESLHLPYLDRLSTLSDTDIALLSAKHSNLKHLTLSIPTQGIPLKITEEGISALAKNCPHLESLQINCNVNDTAMRNLINGCPHMKKIKFSSSTSITDKSFELIGEKWKSLKELEIHFEHSITTQGFEALRNLDALKKLVICQPLEASLDTSLSPLERILNALKNKKHLSLLELDLTPFHSQITPEHLDELKQNCPNLEESDLKIPEA